MDAVERVKAMVMEEMKRMVYRRPPTLSPDFETMVSMVRAAEADAAREARRAALNDAVAAVLDSNNPEWTVAGCTLAAAAERVRSLAATKEQG